MRGKRHQPGSAGMSITDDYQEWCSNRCGWLVLFYFIYLFYLFIFATSIKEKKYVQQDEWNTINVKKRLIIFRCIKIIKILWNYLSIYLYIHMFLYLQDVSLCMDDLTTENIVKQLSLYHFHKYGQRFAAWFIISCILLKRFI